MVVKDFKNANLHLKLEKADINNNITLLELIVNDLSYNDMALISENYCISNYATAFDIYSLYYDTYYSISDYDLEDLKNDKTVILKPSEHLKEFYENTENKDLRENIFYEFNIDLLNEFENE